MMIGAGDGIQIEDITPTLLPSLEIDTYSIEFSQFFDLVVGVFPQATVAAPSPRPMFAVTEGIFVPPPSRKRVKKRFSGFDHFVGVCGDI